MAGVSAGSHATWSSKTAFLLATIGFSVGLGNVWRFPYLAGESGGGAFVLIYIACVLLIGIPIVMAELAIGRRGGMTPAATMKKLALAAGKSRFWMGAGVIAVLTAFLIVSYYCMIGGWTLHYMFLSASEGWAQQDSDAVASAFSALQASPGLLIFWQVVFLALVAIIASRGLNGGIEKAVTFMMPLLFVLLVGLAIYGLFAGDAVAGLTFLFSPDWSQVTARTLADAIGQAFFSVGVGMAALMVYGAYLPKDVDIPQTAVIVVFADSAVAIISGLAVFPFVFANGLSPTEGPGLVFVTLPTAFAQLSYGSAVGIAFFGLLAVAAVTSAIALFEVLAAWGEEHGYSRGKISALAALLTFVVGLLSVFSLNWLQDVHPLAFIPSFENQTFFDVIDRVTATIGLPLGGLFIAIFAGWVLSSESMADEVGLGANSVAFQTWRFLLRWPLPLAISTLLVLGVKG